MVDLDMLLAALAHPTRRMALRLLRQHDELCLCELIRLLAVGQSTMSRHMTALKEAGLVTDRRDAQWVRFRLNPLGEAATLRVVQAIMAAEPAKAASRVAAHDARSAA